MKKTSNRKAFTLIELLVVITIIGILATGAVNVFTTQLQKARDSTRISDINALRNAVEQFYQDTSNYPKKSDKFGDDDGIGNYIQWSAPSDPRTGSASANSVFDYLYSVSPDDNTILLQEYELSTHFENQGNIANRAEWDDWDDNFRLEVWINLDDSSEKPTVVNWPDGLTVGAFTCVTSAWAEDAGCGDSSPLLIK